MPSFARRAIGLAVLLLLLGLAAARAAEPGKPPPGEPGPEELQALLETLEDETKRQRLVAELKALLALRQKAAAHTAVEASLGTRLLTTLSDGAELAAHASAMGMQAILALPGQLASEARTLGGARAWRLLGQGIGGLAATLAAGALLQWLVGWLLRRPRRHVQGRQPARDWPKPLYLGLALLLDLLPLVAFWLAAYGAMLVLQPPRDLRLLVLALINAHVLARALLAAGRAVLAPTSPGLRLLPLESETAHYLDVWLQRLLNAGIYGYFLAEAAAALGLAPAVKRGLLAIVGLVVAALLSIFILQNRREVTELIRGTAPAAGLGLGGLRRRLGEVWHLLALAYVVALYLLWVTRVAGGFDYLVRGSALTIAMLGLTQLLYLGVDRLVRRSFRLGEELRQRYPALERRANRYVGGLSALAKAAIAIFALAVVLRGWGIASYDWLATPLGQRLVGAALSIGLSLLLALLLWDGANTLVERHIARLEAQGNGQRRQSARLRTLLPLLQRAALTVLAVMVILVVLNEIGINVLPLLAGAGVIGIAVGLGAQSLMKDLITGASNLLEDSFAVGDVVTIGSHTGVVEQISMRAVTLRDLSGSVHVVPFSTIGSVTNLTKDRTYALVEVGVDYKQDVDAAMTVMSRVADELAADPGFAGDIAGPAELTGVVEFDESAVRLRIRIPTLPMRRWAVSFEYRRRLKRAFDEAGIAIPFRQVTLHVAPDALPQTPLR
ncbi:MAG: mechanosensitive ion channel [Alphaproteobacteria bacterium]|nr:mechanosensitive ion channel [Alphaproteobacteria bacterium]